MTGNYLKISILLLTGCCCLAGRGESTCFRTIKEAALQAGVRDGEGFQLAGIRLDRVGGGRWARVVSCSHPERPGMALRVPESPLERASENAHSPAAPLSAAAPQSVPAPLVLVGALVHVFKIEQNVRLEMAGVAQQSGGLGDTVKVRVGAVGEERLASAVVRGEGLVMLEEAR